MKAKMIVPAARKNPNGPGNVVVPVGEIIDHADAWKICMPEAITEAIRAEPADEECAAKVAEEMEKREQRIKAREEAEAAAEATKEPAKKKTRRPAK